MILPIITYGDPILRKDGEIVTPDFPNLKQLIEDMFESMYGASGVGLTAHQIGKNLRLFIVDTDVYKEDDPRCENFKKVFINPEIVKEEGEPCPFNEGCLSFPQLREDVYRKPIVTVKYQDENFNWHEETYEGLIARVIQHEYDHSRGIVFIDHLTHTRKRLIQRKLNNIIKGEVKTTYKIKIAKKKPNPVK